MTKLNLKTAFFAAVASLVSFSANAATPGNAANANVYEVTVKKVEMCRSAACDNPYVAGTSTKSFDISSASAGADVGSYVDLQGVPLYQTWSHVRVTIAPSINVSGAGTDDQGSNCCTNSADATSNHTTLGIGTNAVCTGTTQTVFVPDTGAFAGNPTVADYTAQNMSKAAGSDVVVVYPLPQPYTCKGVMPLINVKFDTQSTISFIDANGAGAGQQCRLYPLPPKVTITVTDP